MIIHKSTYCLCTTIGQTEQNKTYKNIYVFSISNGAFSEHGERNEIYHFDFHTKYNIYIAEFSIGLDSWMMQSRNRLCVRKTHEINDFFGCAFEQREWTNIFLCVSMWGSNMWMNREPMPAFNWNEIGQEMKNRI